LRGGILCKINGTGQWMKRQKIWEADEVRRFTNYAESMGQIRYADMVKVGFAFGLRIHEVARLDKNDLLKALNENQLMVKGKGGLIRSVPLHDAELIRRLYSITPIGFFATIIKN
jgi:integrase